MYLPKTVGRTQIRIANKTLLFLAKSSIILLCRQLLKAIKKESGPIIGATNETV